MAPNPYTAYLVASPLPNATELRWPDKDPADIVPALLDATRWLQPGDTINAGAITFSATPDDLTAIGTPSCTGNVIGFALEGGSFSGAGGPATDYACTVTFTTQMGFSCTRIVWCRVIPLSQNQSYAPNIAIIQGPQGVSIVSASFDSSTGSLQLGTSDGGTLDVVGAIDLLGGFPAYLAGLPTAPPTTSGVLWLDSGVPTLSGTT